MRDRVVRGGVVAAALLIAAPGARAGGSDESAALQEIWKDPEFQKQFLGSYGFQSEIEPRLTAMERQAMEKILPLLVSGSETAVVELEKLITPESSAVFEFTLGNLYFQKDDMHRAARLYAAAIEKFPSFRRAHKNLGLIQVKEGKFPEAVGSLSRVIELGGADGLTYGLLGYSYSSTGQFLSAESAYRNALLLQRDVRDWKLGLTQAVFKQGRYGEAVTLCQELIEAYPDRPEYWLLQANAYIGLDDPMKAAENFEFVRRMGKPTVGTLRTLGDIYVNQGLWDLAASSYREAVDLDPGQDVAGPLRWVEILAQRGALAEARSLMSRVREVYEGRIDAGDHKKLLKLEARIAVAGGEGGSAVGVLEEIVALDPLDGEALILLAQHYAANDDPDRAIFYLERAESLEKYEADARIRHAQVLVKQSRYGEAVPLLKRAQEIQPRDDVARYLEQVERVLRSSR